MKAKTNDLSYVCTTTNSETTQYIRHPAYHRRVLTAIKDVLTRNKSDDTTVPDKTTVRCREGKEGTKATIFAIQNYPQYFCLIWIDINTGVQLQRLSLRFFGPFLIRRLTRSFLLLCISQRTLFTAYAYSNGRSWRNYWKAQGSFLSNPRHPENVILTYSRHLLLLAQTQP